MAIYVWDRDCRGDVVCQETAFVWLPRRMDLSCSGCQRLCEYGDNKLYVSVSGFHMAQIPCQDNILRVLTFHCKIFLITPDRNCICLFFIVVLKKSWLLGMDRIGNHHSKWLDAVTVTLRNLLYSVSQIGFDILLWDDRSFHARPLALTLASVCGRHSISFYFNPLAFSSYFCFWCLGKAQWAHGNVSVPV